MCHHMESSRRALVKEFFSNLGERKNLTCYVRGRWVPFGERTISQLFKLKGGGDCSEFEKLQKNSHFEEIATELTGGRQGEWQSTRTISHAFINRGDLTEVGKVWFYFLNSVLKPSKHVWTLPDPRPADSLLKRKKKIFEFWENPSPRGTILFGVATYSLFLFIMEKIK